MGINDLNSEVRSTEEETVCALDNVYLFLHSDADLEAMASMPIEEVDRQLIRMGLDPNAPLPARILKLIPNKEDQIVSSSVAEHLDNTKVHTAKAGSMFGGFRERLAESSLQLARSYAAAFAAVFGLIVFVTYISLHVEDHSSLPSVNPVPKESNEKSKTCIGMSDASFNSWLRTIKPEALNLSGVNSPQSSAMKVFTRPADGHLPAWQHGGSLNESDSLTTKDHSLSVDMRERDSERRKRHMQLVKHQSPKAKAESQAGTVVKNTNNGEDQHSNENKQVEISGGGGEDIPRHGPPPAIEDLKCPRKS